MKTCIFAACAAGALLFVAAPAVASPSLAATGQEVPFVIADGVATQPPKPAEADAISSEAARISLDKKAVSELDRYVRAEPVPKILALDTIGNTDLQPAQPTSGRTLLATMTGFVKDGQVKPGLAAEMSLRAFGVGAGTTNKDYKKSWLNYGLPWSSFSVATGPADGSDVRTAYGLRFLIVDYADFRFNKKFSEDFVNATKYDDYPEFFYPTLDPNTGDPVPEKVVEAGQAVAMERMGKAIDAAYKGLRWNALQSAAGLTGTVMSPGGTAVNSRPETEGGWVSVAGPIFGEEQPWQLLGTGRLTKHEAYINSKNQGINDQWLAGLSGRLTYRGDDYRLMLDAGVGHNVVTGAAPFSIDRTLLAATLQYRVGEKDWVEMSANLDVDGVNTKAFALSGIKWGFNPTPTLDDVK